MEKPIIKNKLILLFIAISLCSVQYHRVRVAVMSGPHLEYKVNSYVSLNDGLKGFHEYQKYFWKGRIVSCASSNFICKVRGLDGDKMAVGALADAIAMDAVIWLLFTFLAVIFLSKNPFLFILGIGAALQYAWCPASESQVNPWDMPTLFFWTLILLVNNTKKKKLILILIPIAAFYKEIVAVLSILILFWDDTPIKKRILLFITIGVSCVLVKIGCSWIGGSDSLLGNQSYHYEHKCRTGEYWILHRNFNCLFRGMNFNPVYFAMAGLWLPLFLLPIEQKYKIIALVYIGTVFIPGNITEARLWQELIPVFFVGYNQTKKGLV